MTDEKPVCGGPDCENHPVTGSLLCVRCEGRWMRERCDVVDTAEHLTALAAEFARWCVEHGHPNPHE